MEYTLSNLKSGAGSQTKNNKREESSSEFREERAKSNKIVNAFVSPL